MLTRRFNLMHIAATAVIASMLTKGELMLALLVALVTAAVVALMDPPDAVGG